MTISVFLSGGASNIDQAASLGGAISNATAPLEIFGAVPVEDFSGSVRYRCVYVKATTAQNGLVVWVASETPSLDTTVAIGWGAAINETEDTVANESTAPSGVTFSSPDSRPTGASGGDFSAGDYRALWIRYTITSTSPKPQELFQLGIGSDASSSYFNSGYFNPEYFGAATLNQ